VKEVPRVGAFYRLSGRAAICQCREQEASTGVILPWLLLSLRPLLSVKWMFLDVKLGHHGLCTGMINMLLCTLSPHLDSHVLIHVIELGGKALHVCVAFRLEAAEAG